MLADRDRRDGQRHLFPGGGEYLGRVEPAGVAAPVGDDDSPTVRQRAREHVPGVEDLDALEREPVVAVRASARRQHDAVCFGEVVGAEPDLDARRLELPLRVREEAPRDLGPSGRGPGQRKLSSEAIRALEQHHVVPGAPGLGRRGNPGRAAADHDEPLPVPRLRRAEVPLPARARVHRASERRAGVVVRDARVAADAADDLAHAPLAGLLRKLGIGDQRARHSERLGAARSRSAGRRPRRRSSARSRSAAAPARTARSSRRSRPPRRVAAGRSRPSRGTWPSRRARARGSRRPPGRAAPRSAPPAASPRRAARRGRDPAPPRAPPGRLPSGTGSRRPTRPRAGSARGRGTARSDSGARPRARPRRGRPRRRARRSARSPRSAPRSPRRSALGARRGSAGSAPPRARSRAVAEATRSARGRRAGAGRRAASRGGRTAAATRS